MIGVASRPASVRGSMAVPLTLIAIIGLAAGFHLFGIQRNLPFTAEMDEPVFVTRAVNMAATANLNPAWFGHPGSTVLYPLTGIYHTWNALAHDGPLFGPDATLLSTFRSDAAEFYILGRLLTISYAVMAVGVVYLMGRRVFGERVALTAAGFSMLYPVAVLHAQTVRTDSAAAFFGLLSLWLCLRLYDRPTGRNQIFAGLAIAAAISSRYFMVTLIPVLVAVDGMIMWRHISQKGRIWAVWPSVGMGLLAVAGGFALTTPYFFLDLGTAWANISHEGRSAHLGADGLSPHENFIWYLTSAIPRSVTLPQMAVGILGVALIVWRHRPAELLLLAFALVFLVAISSSALHWQRWAIPVLPLFALFGAYGLCAVVGRLSLHLGPGLSAQRALFLVAILSVAAWPAYRLVLQDIGLANPSTRVLAREWVMENLPAGSRIAQEWYTAPLDGTDFVVSREKSLSEHPLDDYYGVGIDYLMVSSTMYGRFYAEPGHYVREVAFYERLFAEGELVQELEPSNIRSGPVIRIYNIADP